MPGRQEFRIEAIYRSDLGQQPGWNFQPFHQEKGWFKLAGRPQENRNEKYDMNHTVVKYENIHIILV